MQSIITSMVIITRCCKNKNALLRWRCISDLRDSHSISLCGGDLLSPPRHYGELYFTFSSRSMCSASRHRIAASPDWAASRRRVRRILKRSSLAAALIDLLSARVAPARSTSLGVIWSSGVRWFCSNAARLCCWENYLFSQLATAWAGAKSIVLREKRNTSGIVRSLVMCKDMT